MRPWSPHLRCQQGHPRSRAVNVAPRIADSLEEWQSRGQRMGGDLPADVVIDLVNRIAGDARRIQELATNGLITITDA